jgi:23S rRNA pseudouridine2605 synthase
MNQSLKTLYSQRFPCSNKILWHPNTRLFSTTHRLERIISNRGGGSRNEVAKLISQGRVCANGKVIKSGSIKFPTDCIITIDGKSISALPLLAVYNKPINVISSIGDPWGRTSLTSLYTEYPFLKQMHPVGRLDADTSGLLLFSKDGKLTQYLLNPHSEIIRIYEAHVLGAVNFNELQMKLKEGVNTTDGSFPAELLFCEHYQEVSLHQKNNFECF